MGKSNKNESVKEFDEIDNTNTNQQLIFNSVKIGRPKKSEKNNIVQIDCYKNGEEIK